MFRNIFICAILLLAYVTPILAQPQIRFLSESAIIEGVEENDAPQWITGSNLIFNDGDDVLDWQIEPEVINYPDESMPAPDRWFILDDSAGVTQPGDFSMVTFRLAYGMMNGGMYEILFHVHSNDPGRQVTEFFGNLDIHGRPRLSPVPSSIDFNEIFGVLQPDVTYTMPIRWFNSGSDDLEVNDALIEHEAFQVNFDFDHNVARIGEFLTATVSFTPNDTGDFAADLEVVSNDPNPPDGEAIRIPLSATVSENGIRDGQPADRPEFFAITSVSPNPFNSSTTINYSLPSPGRYAIDIVDIQGRLVTRLADGWKEAGSYRQIIDGGGCVSGAYFIRIKSSKDAITAPIILSK